MIDRATRWPEVAPIPDMTAETVADTFISYWISRYGCPSKATTDQGRQFESNLFHEVCKKIGSKRIRTCAYHPQSNGLIENFHRTLKTAITSCPDPTQWSKILPFILLILRTAVNTSVKTSPAEALYGQELRLPGDVFIPNPPHDAVEISKRIADATSTFHDLTHHDSKHRVYISTLR